MHNVILLWMMKALRGGPAGRRDSPVCEVNHPKRDVFRHGDGPWKFRFFKRQEMVHFNRNLVSQVSHNYILYTCTYIYIYTLYTSIERERFPKLVLQIRLCFFFNSHKIQNFTLKTQPTKALKLRTCRKLTNSSSFAACSELRKISVD